MFNVVHIHNLCLYTRYLAREFGLNGANNVSNAQVFFHQICQNPRWCIIGKSICELKSPWVDFIFFLQIFCQCLIIRRKRSWMWSTTYSRRWWVLFQNVFSSSNLFHLWDAFAVHGYVLERSVREGGEDERGGGQHFASGASQVIFKIPLLVNLLVKVPSKRFHLNRVF